MRSVLVIACLLPLAACNKGPQVNEKNASVAEVAQKVRDSAGDQSFVRAGLWQSKVTIEKFDIPGMPPEMIRRMKTMMAENQEHDFQTCLTPEDVKRPKEDFFAGENKSCRYEHFTMAAGRIDAAMHCGSKDGGTQVMQMAGTYSPDNYQMQTSMKMEGGGTRGTAMAMSMRIEAQRVGECKPAQG